MLPRSFLRGLPGVPAVALSPSHAARCRTDTYASVGMPLRLNTRSVKVRRVPTGTSPQCKCGMEKTRAPAARARFSADVMATTAGSDAAAASTPASDALKRSSADMSSMAGPGSSLDSDAADGDDAASGGAGADTPSCGSDSPVSPSSMAYATVTPSTSMDSAHPSGYDMPRTSTASSASVTEPSFMGVITSSRSTEPFAPSSPDVPGRTAISYRAALSSVPAAGAGVPGARAPTYGSTV